MAKHGQDKKPLTLKVECEGGILDEVRNMLKAIREFVSGILDVTKESICDILVAFKELICDILKNLRFRIQNSNRRLSK